MPPPKWYAVARNEYRVITSSIRKVRSVLPFIAIPGLVIFVALLLGFMIDEFMDEVVAFFISMAALATLQITLLTFFFMMMTYPIGLALRDEQTEQVEIFLSAPIRPSHVLLGKFLGSIPVFSIPIAIFATLFVALLRPFKMDALQNAIIIASVVIALLTALWIGTVIAAILRTKLARSARGRDIGKALPMLIALPSVAVLYAIMGGWLQEALSNPDNAWWAERVMAVFPTSWIGDMMLDFAYHPGDTSAVLGETVLRLAGVIIFFAASLAVGNKVADRAYSLETSQLGGTVASRDGRFYRGIRAIGGRGAFSTILVTTFKDYGRKLQNISNITYAVGLVVLINLFLNRDSGLEGSVFMAIIIYIVLAGMVVGEVTVKGKESLFLYRKSPGGEARLVKAKLIHGWVIVVPICLLVTLLTLGMTSAYYTYKGALALLGFILFYSMAIVVLALGTFLMFPVFSDKPAELMGNIMVLGMISFFLFLACLFTMNDIVLAGGVFLIVIWAMAFTLLYLGLINLKRIE